MSLRLNKLDICFSRLGRVQDLYMDTAQLYSHNKTIKNYFQNNAFLI